MAEFRETAVSTVQGWDSLDHGDKMRTLPVPSLRHAAWAAFSNVGNSGGERMDQLSDVLSLRFFFRTFGIWVSGRERLPRVDI